MGIKRKIGDLSRRIDTKWAIEVREIEDEIENGLFSETKQVKKQLFCMDFKFIRYTSKFWT